jgi:hypothetical protein
MHFTHDFRSVALYSLPVQKSGLGSSRFPSTVCCIGRRGARSPGKGKSFCHFVDMLSYAFVSHISLAQVARLKAWLKATPAGCARCVPLLRLGRANPAATTSSLCLFRLSRSQIRFSSASMPRRLPQTSCERQMAACSHTLGYPSKLIKPCRIKLLVN